MGSERGEVVARVSARARELEKRERQRGEREEKGESAGREKLRRFFFKFEFQNVTSVI